MLAGGGGGGGAGVGFPMCEWTLSAGVAQTSCGCWMAGVWVFPQYLCVCVCVCVWGEGEVFMCVRGWLYVRSICVCMCAGFVFWGVCVSVCAHECVRVCAHECVCVCIP